MPSRLGLAQGDLVLEVGYDDECDDELRQSLKAITGTDFLSSDIQDAAPTCGLSQTSTVAVAKDWTATRLVARKGGKR